MAAKRIIAVVGATGAQGGSVVRALFRDPSNAYDVRALTRTPDSEAARNLARLGAEVVFADADDLASLKQAFSGAYGAYCVTNFWEHGSPDRECAQAAAMAEAARCVGVQHVIWSTLEDTRRVMPLSDNRMPTLMGKFKVPHYDGKGEADDAFRRLSVPTTFFLTSFYWENFIRFPGMGLRKDPSGELTLSMPLADKKMPGIAVDDIGLCALGVFKQVCSTMGQTIGIAGEHLTGTEMAAAFTKALGRDVRYTDVAPEVYRTWDFPSAPELSNMLQFKRDFNELFCSVRDVERSRQLNPSLQTFEGWLSRHAGEFTL
jgi:uncharacterized protein YbjT (DUF2867 family)